jgi:hypothetical protein
MITTVTPTFSAMTDLNMMMSMSLDVADCRFKLTGTKPELETTF